MHTKKNKSFYIQLSVFCLLALFVGKDVFAAARTAPFLMGETLDPGLDAQPCGPSDTNCYPSLNIIPPTGAAAGSGGIMGYQELTANGTNTISFRAPDSIASNIIWTLPGTDGLLNQVMVTNGTGVLSWASVAGGSAAGGTGAIQFASGASFAGDNTKFFWDNTEKSLALGTSSAFAKFSLQSAFGSTTPLFDIATTTSSAWATSSLFRINANGNIGIGTTSPYAKLSVVGTGVFENIVATGTPASSIAAALGLGITGPGAKLDIVGTSTEYVQSAEMIVSATDRDFSGAGNWVGTNWAVAGGVATHVAGNNNFTLDNAFLTSPITAGKMYIVTFTVTTTATAPGFGLQIFVGGTVSNSSQYGDYVGTETALAMIKAGASTQITFDPSAIWTGSIDNVSVTEWTPAAPTQILRNQNGTIAVEWRSGGNNQNSVFIGQDTGKWTDSSYSVAIGHHALSRSYNGFANIGIGAFALETNTEGIDNIAMGYGSLINNSSGSDNIASGYQSMWYNTTGSYNVAHGTDALMTNNIGSYNVASGYSALTANTTGSHNVGAGDFALGSNTTGSYNVASGHNALFSNTTGSSSVAVGWKSLYGNNTGASSTAIGAFAGLTNTSGRNNLFAGDEADALSGTLTNAAAIGSHAKVKCANCLVLGGTGLFAARVGVGTTSPYAKLSVQDTFGSTTPLFDIATTTSTAFATTTFFRVNANGYVGIGTSSPYRTLSASGTAAFTGTTTIGIPGQTVQNADLMLPFGSICVDNDGTCTPTSSGQISARGFNTGGSDLAENYLTFENISAGDIVMLAGSSTFVSLAESGSTGRIIGIASTIPGITLGADLDDNIPFQKVPLALSGRVPVKVNLENGPIYRGDHITISSVPGVGMKASETSRVTVAIAMEDYTGSGSELSGDGTHRILAFVNLSQRSAEPYSLANEQAQMMNSDGSLTFAGRFFERIKIWLADTMNGIDTIIARVFVAKDIHTQRLCLGTEGDETCITKAELDRLLLENTIVPPPAEDIPPPEVVVAEDPAPDENTPTLPATEETESEPVDIPADDTATTP